MVMVYVRYKWKRIATVCVWMPFEQNYRQTSNISGTKSNIFVTSCSCLCSIYWSHLLSREWRCSWSSAEHQKAMLQLQLSDKKLYCLLSGLTVDFAIQRLYNWRIVVTPWALWIYCAFHSLQRRNAILFACYQCRLLWYILKLKV